MEGQPSGFKKFLRTRAGKWVLGFSIVIILAVIGNLGSKDHATAPASTTVDNTRQTTPTNSEDSNTNATNQPTSASNSNIASTESNNNANTSTQPVAQPVNQNTNAKPATSPAVNLNTAPPPNTNKSTSGFSCSVTKSCDDMVSCDEAYYYLNTCAKTSLDRDKDGIPCESLCK